MENLPTNSYLVLMNMKLKTIRFEDFLNKEFDTILTSLTSFKKDNNYNHLHELRVSIKKIRSVIKVFYAEEKSIVNILKDLKKLFKGAGEIREMQLNATMLNDFELNRHTAYFKLLRSITDSIGAFKSNISSYKKAVKTCAKKVKIKSKSISIKRSEKLILKQEKDFLILLRQKPKSSEHLHNIRKELKILHYIYKFLPNQQKYLFSLKLEEANELQEKLGHWHDLETHLEFLNKHMPEKKKLLNILTGLKEREYEECMMQLKKHTINFPKA